MSIKIVEAQIQKFLSSEDPEVLAINGAWGVGKTYSWAKYLVEAQKENRISLERYSYVSLFGVNSLDALKFSIFEHAISRELIGTEASIETFKNNTTHILESYGRKATKWFQMVIPSSDFTPALESLSFLSLNKSLICIDDLERTGDGLPVKDVFVVA